MIDEVASIERIESDLDALIERRARDSEEANAEEMMWKASVRKHNARLREKRLWQRLDYHQQMLEAHTRTFEGLLRRHRTGLRLCEQALGIGDEQHDEEGAA